MFGPSPHSVWNTDDLDGMIGPLWGEADEAKRKLWARGVIVGSLVLAIVINQIRH